MTDNAAEFTALHMIAADVDATLDFYRRLGLDIPEEKLWRTPSGVHHVGDVSAGNAAFEFDSRPLAEIFHAGYRASPTTAIIGFRVSSRERVDALYTELTEAGYDGRQEPYDAFWGARYAIVADPDGRDVSLMSPVDPGRRTAPPEL